MEQKSNKELAIEATIEYTKSWNSAHNTNPMRTDDFVNCLTAIYKAICALDNTKS